MTGPPDPTPDGGSPTASRSKLVISYVIGAMIGGWLALPTIQPMLEAILVGQSMGSIGRTLAIGVLLLVAVTLGTVALFQLFMFIDY